jgi:hypothetical protein
VSPDVAYKTRVERVDKHFDEAGREHGWTLILKRLETTVCYIVAVLGWVISNADQPNVFRAGGPVGGAVEEFPGRGGSDIREDLRIVGSLHVGGKLDVWNRT